MFGPVQYALDGIVDVENQGYVSGDNDQYPWIAINLEKAFIIKQIRITGRAIYNFRRLGNFKVQ